MNTAFYPGTTSPFTFSFHVSVSKFFGVQIDGDNPLGWREYNPIIVKKSGFAAIGVT